MSKLGQEKNKKKIKIPSDVIAGNPKIRNTLARIVDTLMISSCN